MAESVNVPGLGGMDKKKVLMVGGAVILGIAYYRHKKAAGVSATSTATANPIDPATGYPQGSPEDLNALALQGTNPSGASVGGGGGGIVDTNGTQNPNQTTSFVDNAHWHQAAVAYLDGLGESPTAVSAALSKYLAGEPVTPDERVYIDQANAAMNQPPIGGPNGYPPMVHMVPTSSGGLRLAAPSLRVAAKKHGQATLSWNAVPNAHQYELYRNGVHSGTWYTSTSGYVHSNGTYTLYAIPSSNQNTYIRSVSSNAVPVTGI